MKRLIAVLEELLVYTSTAKTVADINVAAGISLHELRRVTSLYESEGLFGQETGRNPEPELKAI